MTAAIDVAGQQESQHWCRTVYLRQGRFFVISVTVRNPHHLPLRTAFPKTYTTGRFTVREEWVLQQAPEDTKPALLHTHTRWLAAWSQAAQQQHWLQQEPDVSHDQDSTQQQQQQQQQQQEPQLTPNVQSELEEERKRPWWSWLFAARPPASQKPSPSDCQVPDGPVSISCLQLRLSWSAAGLRRTLSNLSAAVRRTGLFRMPGSSRQAAGSMTEQQQQLAAGADGVDCVCKVSGAAGLAGGKQQAPVQISVAVGSNWCFEMVSVQVSV